MGRWIAVRACAFALRHGATVDQLAAALATAFRHRDDEWRQTVLHDARWRNRNKAAIGAP